MVDAASNGAALARLVWAALGGNPRRVLGGGVGLLAHALLLLHPLVRGVTRVGYPPPSVASTPPGRLVHYLPKSQVRGLFPRKLGRSFLGFCPLAAETQERRHVFGTSLWVRTWAVPTHRAAREQGVPGALALGWWTRPRPSPVARIESAQHVLVLLGHLLTNDAGVAGCAPTPPGDVAWLPAIEEPGHHLITHHQLLSAVLGTGE